MQQAMRLGGDTLHFHAKLWKGVTVAAWHSARGRDAGGQLLHGFHVLRPGT